MKRIVILAAPIVWIVGWFTLGGYLVDRSSVATPLWMVSLVVSSWVCAFGVVGSALLRRAFSELGVM
ncbi:hypothetical protein AA103196_3110 [Ameyamaea chiangmaiensis NBRC 103196]|nr:hypothetical protein AA103196_3110 [Ameyamaea chiangmaiensis NBRC 103196]